MTAAHDSDAGPKGPRPPCGRYAPSPSGRLHLGNARTALLAWLQMRALGGRFIMRIEDLDPQRSKPEHETRLLEDLRWLGLDWDEGVERGGPHGPYRQSECGDIYAAALARLDTYGCSCTRREVREAVRAPHAGEAGNERRYPGTCAGGPAHPERDLATRVRVPAGTHVRFNDALVGQVVEDLSDEVGDFVLRRSDGAWAYQLAVVVDDARMGVTHVLRGADLLDSAARQLWLCDALGEVRPLQAHVPLVLGPDGHKLNKRHGAPDLSALRTAGEAPERVVAALARSCDLVSPSCTRVRAQELITDFDLSRLRPKPGPVRL